MASSKLTRRLYPTKKQFISKEDLKETESLLSNLKFSQSKKALHYKAWVEQREKSIEAIGRLEKKLKNMHQTCNAAQGVGAAMEVVGGVAMIAGAILSACGHKNIGEFLTKKVSPVTGVTGMATMMSSSVAETGLTHMTMKEVKMVLRKDEECTRVLMENLKRSEEIDSYLRRIFNCSILSNIFLDVVRLCQDCISLLDVAVVETSKLDEVLVKLLKRKVSKGADISELTKTVIQNVCTTMKKISNDPEVRKAVWNICDIIQRSSSAFEFIKLGLRISFQICDIPKMDIFANLLGFGALKATAGGMATKCLLGTVIIATNVVSVISAVQDAQEGTSKYSKMLRELNLALAMELKTVRENYSKLL